MAEMDGMEREAVAMYAQCLLGALSIPKEQRAERIEFEKACSQTAHEFVENRIVQGREINQAKVSPVELGFAQHILDLRRDSAHSLIERLSGILKTFI